MQPWEGVALALSAPLLYVAPSYCVPSMARVPRDEVKAIVFRCSGAAATCAACIALAQFYPRMPVCSINQWMGLSVSLGSMVIPVGMLLAVYFQTLFLDLASGSKAIPYATAPRHIVIRDLVMAPLSEEIVFRGFICWVCSSLLSLTAALVHRLALVLTVQYRDAISLCLCPRTITSRIPVHVCTRCRLHIHAYPAPYRSRARAGASISRLFKHNSQYYSSTMLRRRPLSPRMAKGGRSEATSETSVHPTACAVHIHHTLRIYSVLRVSVHWQPVEPDFAACGLQLAGYS